MHVGDLDMLEARERAREALRSRPHLRLPQGRVDPPLRFGLVARIWHRLGFTRHAIRMEEDRRARRRR